MTNREYINSLTNKELANILFSAIQDCNNCPIKQYCEKLPGVYECDKIWINWLKSRHKEVE